MKTGQILLLSAIAVLAMSGTASADDLRFTAKLSGAQEVVTDMEGTLVPGGTDTSAFGRLFAEFNEAFSRVDVTVRVADLVGEFAAAHFHCGRAGENGPVVFGLINPGMLPFDGERIRGVLRNGDYTGADCLMAVGRTVNNIASLEAAMRDGLIYVNVHTSEFPPGEIRGQVRSTKQSYEVVMNGIVEVDE